MMEGKGPGADSEEKREPVSDIDTAVADSLKVLDLKRPIREADSVQAKARLPPKPTSPIRDSPRNKVVACFVSEAWVAE